MNNQNHDHNASVFMFIQTNNDTQNRDKLLQVSKNSTTMFGFVKLFHKKGICFFVY